MNGDPKAKGEMLKTSWDIHEALHIGLQHVHVGRREEFSRNHYVIHSQSIHGAEWGEKMFTLDHQEIRCLFLKKLTEFFLKYKTD